MSDNLRAIKMHACRLWVASAACAVIGWTSAAFAESQVRVRLKDGGFVAGAMASNSSTGSVAIDSPTFKTPIELEIGAIRSIDQLDRNQPSEPTKQSFVLSGGHSISGELLKMDETLVTVKSPSLGEVTFPRQMLREFSDSSFSGRLVYSGPRTGVDWQSTEKPEDWVFEAGSISTSKAGACIIGDVKLPDRCEVRFALSWTRTPDFVLSLGCAKDSKGSDNDAAVRLEIWDGDLAMVREVGGNADVALISDYAGENNRLNLIVYLDQTSGLAAVSTLNGKLLESLELKSDKAKPQNFVKLSNHGQENYQSVFRLERFEVREWDGHLPDGKGEASGQIINAKGEAIEGSLGNFNAETGELQVLQGADATTTVKLSEIRRAQFPSAEGVPTTQSPDEKKSAEEPDAQKPAVVNDTIEVELIDRSRLTGKWLESAAGRVSFEVKGFPAPVIFDVSQLVGLVGDATSYKNSKLVAEPTTPKGRLQTANCELAGAMVGFEDTAVKTFLWQAESAVAPVTLTEATSGKVEFSAGASKTTSAKAKATAEAQAQAMQIRPAVNKPRAASSPRARRMTIGLEFRTGDVVEGTVKAIDEKGVTFASENTQTTFVPHSNLESITLRPNRDAVNETPQKLERLMTVPRSMKADPPTHLLISTNGDYLRGRLVSLNESKTVLEVRLENVELPTEQIAQIYWLHDRQWDKLAAGAKEAGKQPEGEPEVKPENKSVDKPVIEGESTEFQVHAIRKDSRGITFVPKSVRDGKLLGKSFLLGDCEQVIADLQVILFGRDVGAQARALKKEIWKLSLAQLPKVYQEGEGGASAETQSPLVGKPAPNFKLMALDDTPHQLSSYIGKVVVLDFWASWCGPCMKTMPEVDRVVKEIGGNDVELIAVNLQEGKERINTAVARLALAATVLLDVDGEVAQQYEANAIPQTVIINRQGVITHLFVGGGNKFVAEFSTALKATLDAK
jgi:thiol-disulfide isomerase/thioredoxin